MREERQGSYLRIKFYLQPVLKTTNHWIRLKIIMMTLNVIVEHKLFLQTSLLHHQYIVCQQALTHDGIPTCQ